MKWDCERERGDCGDCGDCDCGGWLSWIVAIRK